MRAEKVRVRIVSREGVALRDDGLMIAKDPEGSVPHIGKEGWMVEDDEAIEGLPISVPRITLDDGTVLWGFDCWWEPADA